MKTYKLLFLFFFLLISRISFSDIIPDHSHYVDKCVKITNLSDYSDISLVGYISNCLVGCLTTYKISSSTCLTKGYKFNTLLIIAVKSNYLTGKDITAIDWSKDKNAVISSINIEPYAGYLDNSNPISAIDQFYKIVGFTDTSVVLYKWKEINKFNNGKPDSIKTYSYSDDSTKLSQKIATKIKTNLYNSAIELYPNPTQKNFHLKITNNYHGSVSIKIHTIDGKTVRTLIVDKSETLMDYNLNVDNVAKGYYLVDVIMGKAVEVKKIMIE
jgi:hypothetical protein